MLMIAGFARSLLNFRGPLLKEMISRAHDVIACAPDATRELAEELRQMGVAYISYPLARTGLSPAQDLKSYFALKKIIQEVKPDKLLAYTAKPVIYSSLAAGSVKGIQVYSMITGLGYAFVNNSLKRKPLNLLVSSLFRIALRKNSCVFFQNPEDKQLFIEKGLISTQMPAVITNGSGVDLDWYQPVPLPDKPVFLFVGRLLKEKGVREFYEAASLLKSKYPCAVFNLVGGLDSNPASITQSELNEWQDQKVVDYLGKYQDVRLAYTDAQVFVLPSYREGTPRTVLEAMAMGRPIVTTDAPGCRETVINEENGLLVPPQNITALAEAMERIILDPSLAHKMGQASVQMAKEKYDVHKVNKVILDAMGL